MTIALYINLHLPYHTIPLQNRVTGSTGSPGRCIPRSLGRWVTKCDPVPSLVQTQRPIQHSASCVMACGSRRQDSLSRSLDAFWHRRWHTVYTSAYGASPLLVSRASRSVVASFSQSEADRKVLERAHRPGSTWPVASNSPPSLLLLL